MEKVPLLLRPAVGHRVQTRAADGGTFASDPPARVTTRKRHRRCGDVARSPHSGRARSLTLLEFHWPDSGLGNWGSPYTFLEMLPWMRPHALPGCRVVVCTVLRDPVTLYPSLQRHQYDAMREYGREDLARVADAT